MAALSRSTPRLSGRDHRFATPVRRFLLLQPTKVGSRSGDDFGWACLGNDDFLLDPGFGPSRHEDPGLDGENHPEFERRHPVLLGAGLPDRFQPNAVTHPSVRAGEDGGQEVREVVGRRGRRAVPFVMRRAVRGWRATRYQGETV